MRLAFVSPLPPARTGIADYSAALLPHLKRAVGSLEVFSKKPERFDPSSFDAALYQIGNNSYHDFVYEMALEYPGIAVMHEANLHHLIAEITIKRRDWDSYLRELEYDGGAAAVAYGQRVRALEVGPDYDGVPMIRRLLERSRALVVHSRFMQREIRAAGFKGPVACIPHGVWIPELNRMAYRLRLGLDDERIPLIGIFGFLKPYKRIAESLRAFRRLLRLVPEARMILAGEPHPDFPLQNLISALGIGPSVRMLGFVPEEDLPGYIAACDVVLNLRHPTVGESSGTLMRAFGLGRAVLVSDVGSFAEFPDEICLKVPVDRSEEEFLFEYLNLLVSRPEMAREMGESARRWAALECSWHTVAGRYASFLQSVVDGAEWAEPPEPAIPVLSEPVPVPVEQPDPAQESLADYILGWGSSDAGARAYTESHLTRFQKTLRITPPGGLDDSILEMGTYLQITPALRNRLGYGHVRGCYYGPAGTVTRRAVTSASGETFECDVDLFDAEKDVFPYCDGQFNTVLCCELIEHLFADPMHMMSEINRILKPGGRLVLTTPNISSLRAINAILTGYNPGFFPAYLKPSPSGEVDARHNREYTPREIHLLLADSGFEVDLLETGEFSERPRPEVLWVEQVLRRFQLPAELRGDGIYAVGRKTGVVRERYPGWLYSGL